MVDTEPAGGARPAALARRGARARRGAGRRAGGARPAGPDHRVRGAGERDRAAAGRGLERPARGPSRSASTTISSSSAAIRCSGSSSSPGSGWISRSSFPCAPCSRLRPWRALAAALDAAGAPAGEETGRSGEIEPVDPEALPALLLPAAPLVHRPAPAGQLRVQRPPRCGSPARRRRSSPRSSARWSAATRGCARPSRGVDGQPVQIARRPETLPLVWTSRPCRLRERTGRPGPSRPGGVRTGRSTSRADRSCAPSCSGWHPESRCSSSPCTTSSRTLVVGVLVREISALSGAPRPAGLHRCPSCRSSTRTSPSGSAAGCAARSSTALLAYWRERLEACRPGVELPDGPAAASLAHPGPGRRLTDRFPPVSRPARRRSPAGDEGTPSMILLAAFQRTSRLTGREELTVGSPIGQPTGPRRSRLIGFFVNHWCCAATSRATRASEELLGPRPRRRPGRLSRTRTCLSSGWSRSCSRSAISPAPARSRCSSAATRTPSRRLDLPGLTVRPCLAVSGTAKFDLEPEVTGTPAACCWRGSSTAPTCSTARPAAASARAFREPARGGGGAAGRRLAQLPLLSPTAETGTVLAANGTTARSAGGARSPMVPRLSRRAASSRPDAIAVGHARTDRG